MSVEFKKICFIAFYLLFSNAKCQTNNDDLFIQVLQDASYIFKDNKLNIELYDIQIDNQCKSMLVTFKKSQSGILLKNIKAKAVGYNVISFIYNKNTESNKLVPFSINENYIMYEELKNSTLDNLVEIFNSYKNLYLVDDNGKIIKVTYEIKRSL